MDSEDPEVDEPADGPVAPVDDEDEETRPPFFRGLWFLGIVAVALAIFMKTFLIQAFFIPSPSMETTLHGCSGCTGDRVLVNKVVYKFRDIHRGEIVVFNGKDTDFPSNDITVTPPKNVAEKVLRGVQSLVGFGAAGEKDFIKRVIGLPGDVVACCHEIKDANGQVIEGQITINGQPIHEPYVHLSDESPSQAEFEPKVVPPGHLFVMGDHRNQSGDSRYHGTIPQSSVVGRAFAVFYPWGSRKVLRVPDVFDPTKNKPRASGVVGGAGAEILSPPVLGAALTVPIAALRRRRRRSTD